MINQMIIREIIENDNLDQFKLEIEKGLNIFENSLEENSYERMHLLHYALMHKAITISKHLIELYKNKTEINFQVTSKNYSAGSVLHFAIIYTQNPELIKLLIHAGVDVNSLGAYQMPALILAIKQGQIEIAKYLLEHPDINVNLTQRLGGNDVSPSALWWSCYKGFDELIPLMIQKDTELFFRSTEEMLKRESNMKQYCGLLPLHIASMQGHHKVVDCFTSLIDEEDLINCQDTRGYTALHHAKTVQVVSSLIEKGRAKIFIENTYSINCIQALLAKKDKEITNYISRHLLKDVKINQNAQGFFQSYELIRGEFENYDEETKERLLEIITKESATVAGIKEKEHKIIWVKDKNQLVYSSHHPDTAIKSKKTANLPVKDIHGYLKYLHNKYYKELTGKELQTKKLKPNFILAAITFITSTAAHKSGGAHQREHHTFLVSGEESVYVCKDNEPAFLQKLVNRCYTSGSKGATLEFIKKLSQRNERSLNDNDEVEASDFHIKYMHSEQAFMDFMSTAESINKLIHALQCNNITPNFKIYGLGVHIHSTRSLCNNLCKETLIGFQNSKKDRVGFLNMLTRLLQDNGYKLPIRKEQLIVFTSFSANEKHKSLSQLEFETNEIIDINRNGPNSFLIQYGFDLPMQENVQYKSISQKPFSFFASGSKVFPQFSLDTSHTESNVNNNESQVKKQRTK